MNALTSISRTPVTLSRAIVPVRQSATTDRDAHDDARRSQDIHRTAATGNRPHPTYVAAFVAQMLANDNGPSVASNMAADAYWSMNYRLADLPVGFLVSRAI